MHADSAKVKYTGMKDTSDIALGVLLHNGGQAILVVCILLQIFNGCIQLGQNCLFLCYRIYYTDLSERCSLLELTVRIHCNISHCDNSLSQ